MLVGVKTKEEEQERREQIKGKHTAFCNQNFMICGLNGAGATQK